MHSVRSEALAAFEEPRKLIAQSNWKGGGVISRTPDREIDLSGSWIAQSAECAHFALECAKVDGLKGGSRAFGIAYGTALGSRDQLGSKAPAGYRRHQ